MGIDVRDDFLSEKRRQCAASLMCLTHHQFDKAACEEQVVVNESHVFQPLRMLSNRVHRQCESISDVAAFLI